jgi:hypothetical protein
MKYLLVGVTAAIAIAVTVPVWAQSPALVVPQAAPAAPYPLNAPTPDDAYRQGLINRWELEQLVGPTPQALQGPSPNGSRGFDPGS